MNSSLGLEEFTPSMEMMLEQLEQASLSPRGYLLQSLLSDDVEQVTEQLTLHHTKLTLYELIIGIYAVLQSRESKLTGAPVVTLCSRIFTLINYSSKAIEAICIALNKGPTIKELGQFLHKFSPPDDTQEDDDFIANTLNGLAPIFSLEKHFKAEELIPHLSLLYNSKYVSKDEMVPIILALYFLLAAERPPVFDIEAVGILAQCPPFVLSSILTDEACQDKRALFTEFRSYTDLTCWNEEAFQLLADYCTADIAASLDEEFCQQLARSYPKLLPQALERKTRYSLSSVMQLVAELDPAIDQRAVTDALLKPTWYLDTIVMRNLQSDREFVQKWNILAKENDAVIVKFSLTLLAGLGGLKRCSASRETTAFEHKLRAIESIFALIELAEKKQWVTNNLLHSLINLEVTTLADEPMVVYDKAGQALTYSTQDKIYTLLLN